jgi:hypothetical protein
VRNEKVLQGQCGLPCIQKKKRKKERNKANWIDHILRRNRLLKHVIEGKKEETIKVTKRRGTRRKQLLDTLKGKTGYWRLKEKALDSTLSRNSYGRGYEPVVRPITE